MSWIELLFSAPVPGSLSVYVTSILYLGVAGLALSKFLKWYKTYRLFRSIPTPKYSYLTGTVDLILNEKTQYDLLMKTMVKDTHPKMCCMWMGPFKGEIFVYHPETVKSVIMSTAAWKSRGFGKAYEPGVPWVGEGLGTANGHQWSSARKLLQPAFHLDILKNYTKEMNRSTDKLLEILDGYAESGQSVNLLPLINKVTIELTMNCFMGSNVDFLGYDGTHPYLEASSELIDLWVQRSWNPLLYPDWIFRRTSVGKKFYKYCEISHRYSENVIEARRKILEKEGIPEGKHKIFLDALLTARDENGQPLTMMEIRNQVDTLLFAGYDTTSSSILFDLYNLTRHQKWQKRLQEEVDAVLKDRDSDDILWDDLINLKLQDLCSKETKRLFPPGPFINRMLVKDLEIGGKVIPKGSSVMVCILTMHRHPYLWDRPNEFIPERFQKDGGDFEAYIPFSAGPRSCIGKTFGGSMEKIILSRMLHRYDMTLVSDEEVALKPAAFILQPKNPLLMKLTRRENVGN